MSSSYYNSPNFKLELAELMCYNILMRKNGIMVGCDWCGKQVYKTKRQINVHKNQYCSHNCRVKALNHNRVAWNKGTVGLMKPNSGSFKKGERVSVSTEFKPRQHSFKGTVSEYKHIHYKVNILFGKPDKCENCSKDGLTGRKIHWANATGVYDTNRKNWKRLCVKCHAILDKRIPHVKLV